MFLRGRPPSGDDRDDMLFVLSHGDRAIAQDRRGHGRCGRTDGLLAPPPDLVEADPLAFARSA